MVDEGTRLTLSEIRAMPVLAVGQTSNLLIDDTEKGVRVWFSRLTRADGEKYDNQVTIEKRAADGTWYDARRYQALDI